MPRGEPPKVTGLSPMNGPPGTKITIRGEYLGNSADDIISLTISGSDCLPYLEWKSSSKIKARSRTIGTGEIIVQTASGGMGTCTVQFYCYEEIISPTKESAVWVEETDYSSMMGTHKRPSISPTINDTQLNDILGIFGKLSHSSTDRSQTDFNLERFFPGTTDYKAAEYVNPLSNNFIPIWYLVNNYSSVSLNDLIRGYKSLKTKTKSLDQTQQHTFDEDFDMPNRSNNDSFDRIAFLKSNILAIIECLQVLKKLHMAFLKDKKENGPDLTCEVQSYIKNALVDAHAIFDSILAKKDLVDATRNALNILQRQRFLFNLPSSIEKSIQRSDYDIVINEFANAQSLFANTEVSVFKRVYKEVETKIKELHIMLEKKLDSTCQATSEGRNIDDVKKLIRHLMCLDNNKKNHAWDSIKKIQESLISSIDQCHEKYYLLAQNQERENTVTQDAPYVVQFVEEATTTFNDNFQDLYRLGQAYFNDEFPIDEPDELRQQKELEFGQRMIADSILHLCVLLRLALVPDSIKLQDRSPVWPSKPDERYVEYLRHVLCCIINCRSKLNKIELPIYTRTALDDFKDFVFELRYKSMRVLFEQAAIDIKRLHVKEDWNITVDDSFGGRTQLPLLFEKKVNEILLLAKETIFQNTSSEAAIFTRIDVKATMKQLAQSLILAFPLSLDDALINHKEFPAETYHNLIASNGSSKSSSKYINRHLIVICNCLFTTDQIFPRLINQFEKLQYPDMSQVMKKCHNKYFDYEKKIFDKYCREKSKEVSAGLKKAISADKRKLNMINYHIRDCQMNLFQVQSQVFLVAPPLVNKIMDSIIDTTVADIEKISNEFLELDDQPMQEVKYMISNFINKIRRTHVIVCDSTKS